MGDSLDAFAGGGLGSRKPAKVDATDVGQQLTECQLIAEALVREFLKTTPGLTATAKLFERERPKTELSISSRTALRKTLGLEKQAAKLKRRSPEEALPATLELLAGYQLSRVQQANEGSSSMPEKGQVASTKRVVDDPPAPPRSGSLFGGSNISREERALLEGIADPQDAKYAPRAPPSSSGVKPRAAAVEELMVEEVDDLDFGGGSSMQTPSGMKPRTGFSSARSGGGQNVAAGSEPLDPSKAQDMRFLLFGRLGGRPPPSWKQGFFYSSVRDLEYGLVQLEGGPCGVLAAVQAHIVHSVLRSEGEVRGRMSPEEQQKHLVAGLASALWQAGGGTAAQLVTSLERSTSGLSVDQLSAGARVTHISSLSLLEEAVRGCAGLYMEQEGHGIMMFLFSLLLTRGIGAIKEDMDEPETGLMGAHGYCTQELVNLIITGRSFTNVFDGNVDMDGKLLKGLQDRSKIGLLTLFEWYKYVEVGSRLKEPEMPVWVVCCESHFTCLFAGSRRTKVDLGDAFDLIYYDGLAKQDEVIRFTISRDPEGGYTAKVGDSIGERGQMEGELIPPLELVIETRWPGSKVCWNGASVLY
mmetsp:Transcript_30963/g.100864  ORF Transcript_30963/g.100864 Transcript_30963/m.100864 type:complete len:586 (-) Transcript_30963:198-1955(-)